MRKAVFLTYNTVGDGDWPNGQYTKGDNVAIVVSHPRDQRWGAAEAINGLAPTEQNEELAPEDTDEGKAQNQAVKEERMRLVDELYAGVFTPEKLAELDYVVVYVGAGGSQGAIALAAQAGAEKARFVMCDCNLTGKVGMLQAYFNGRVPFIVCECGGRRTMELVLSEFLATGVIAR